MTPWTDGRELATLSLDLDDVWAYLRTRGEDDWATAPSVLPLAVDRLLAVLDELDVRITVFVVGRDAERPEGREAIQALVEAGHEIASHSFLHRGELSLMPAQRITEDLRLASEAISAITGAQPRGFRCPSFGRSAALLQSLLDGGYTYDASVLPTSLSPVLKLYCRLRKRSAEPHVEPQAELFGPVSNAVLPLSAFRWRVGANVLLELPVSTLPLVRTPMHMSYLQAIGAVSEPAAHGYLRLGLASLRLGGISPSFLLHPTDVLDERDAPRLSYFPGMSRQSTDKVRQVRHALSCLVERYEVVPLSEAARRLHDADLPVRNATAVFPVRDARVRPGAAGQRLGRRELLRAATGLSTDRGKREGD